MAKQVFEEGIGLELISKNNILRVYRLNNQTELNVWTDGREHPLAQAYVPFAASHETIIKTAETIKNWSEGVSLKRMIDGEGKPFLFLTINFPEGSDLSLSDQYWSKEKY